jgi:hypothetical protein
MRIRPFLIASLLATFRLAGFYEGGNPKKTEVFEYTRVR